MAVASSAMNSKRVSNVMRLVSGKSQTTTQHGVTKREGGHFKQVFRRVVEETGPNMWDEIEEVVDTTRVMLNNYIDAP